MPSIYYNGRSMNRLLLIYALCVSASCTYAYDMMDVLSKKYDAKTMSAGEIEAVLEDANANNVVRYRLEYKNDEQLFRHSMYADYYLYDTHKKDTIWLTDTRVRDAVMSPNGKYVVYAKPDNNLYVYKVDFKTEVAVTTGENREIFNGISDWLYEEEFGVTRLFDFSPDSKQLAFVRLDETGVPTFEWQTFLGDKHNDSFDASNTNGMILYPALHSLRYPKAGQANAKATVCVYDIHQKTIRTMQLPESMDGYVPRIVWTPLPAATKQNPQPMSDLMVLHVNRDQNRMDVLRGNAKSTVCRPFYTEQSKTYFVNYELFDQWQWLTDGRVVVISEKGGHQQAYLYSSQGIEQRLLTPEARDVTAVYGVDEKNQILYYQAANTPMERQAYALNMKKNTTVCLTQGEGTHTLYFAKDWKRYIDCYQSVTTPHTYTLYEVKGEKLEAKDKVWDNDSILEAWNALGINEKEFFTIETERGDVLNAWRILPKRFDSTKQYPVVMMQYSGPTSQRVLNNWRKRFGYVLSEAGYLVVCADGRGTGARGREWRNATYMQLGIKEAEDQMTVAKYLQSLPYVDRNRIALCGWSYGGYQTLMCMSKQADVGELWKCGIAIAPVTSWRLYDSAYTERFMRRPQVNESGYDGTDLMHMAGDLTGELLIVHGLADDNVHVQNTLLYIDALVKAGKQFDMQLYVDDNHSIRKPENYEHLHKKILLFLQNNL